MSEKSYNRLFGEYIVDCCMFTELACQRVCKKDFDQAAQDLYDHWDEVMHYHKCIVQKENLKTDPYGYNIVFPSLVRQIACHKAAKFTGNPMTNKKTGFIDSYVKAMAPPETQTPTIIAPLGPPDA